jgi:hypothetical protein
MSKSFFQLSADEKLALLSQAANQLDLSELIIEKDLWMCWILEKIFSLPIHMAFKGGTSLSKVFNLIHRFSEDCDITIDYRLFNPELELEHITRSQLRKISEHLKRSLKTYISTTVLPHLHEHITKDFPDEAIEIQLSEDGEQLHFYYPIVANSTENYIREHVLIEFGIRNCTEPCDPHQITPYLEKIINNTDIVLPKPTISTLSPIRTFWEKITLIHVECNRDRFIKSPDRLSRHWYDLYMLNNSWVGPAALLRDDIFKSVIEYKKAFFNASYACYDDCLNRNFKLIPTQDSLKNLAADYSKMISAGMFYQDPPSFDNIISSLKNLESALNQQD